jgi:hypothetical protein
MPSLPRAVSGLFLVVSILLMGGCDPLVNIEGAFFPAWFISGVSGVIAMVLTWTLLRRFGVDQFMWARPFTYVCLLIMYTCLTWLVLYAN